MFGRIQSLLAVCVLVVLGACSTAVDVNAPYVERPTVYAIIDAGDTANYVRVEKSFLTINNSDANAIAGLKDSLYYPSEVLKVTLQALNRSNLTTAGPVITLSEVQDASKDTGLFYAPDQILFKTKAPLNTKYVYRLTILNNKTQKQVSSISSIIPAMRPSDLFLPKPPDGDTTIVFNSIGQVVQFKYYPADSVVRYQVDVDIPVTEILNDQSERPVKHIHWYFSPDRASGTNYKQVGQDYYLTVSDYTSSIAQRYAFFALLKAQLDTTDSQVARRRLEFPLTLTISRVNPAFSNYLDAVRSYNVLTQTKPFYTNIQGGGIGVFGSRNISKFRMRIDGGFVSVCRAKYPILKF